MDFNLCNLSQIQDLMRIFKLSFRKEFGQNFLTDEDVVRTIAQVCAEKGRDTILEIGPGIGTLTRFLCERYPEVVAVEIDKSLIPVLRYTLNDFRNVTLVEGDILKLNLKVLLAPSFQRGPVSVCANLPYYITTPILMELLESRIPFSKITVMVQKEVAQRICAPVGGKDCGAITAVVHYFGKAELLFDVPADRFVPAPKVDSSVMQITLHKEKPVQPRDEAFFFEVIKGAFGQRRKTLPNALSLHFPSFDKDLIPGILASMGLDERIRGERLTLEQFCTLSDLLLEHFGNGKQA